MTFQLLVAGLAALSIGAWWAVQSSVELNQSSRLASEADRIQESIHDRLNTFSYSLIHMRGQFAVSGVPTPNAFHEFVDQLEIQKRFPGMRNIGYVALDKTHTSAKMAMVEPATSDAENAIAFDPLQEPKRAAAMLDSARTGEPAMTEPVELMADGGANHSRALVFFEPVFTTVDRPETTTSAIPRGLGQIAGFVFSTVRVDDFFNGLFGAPSLQNEKANFSVSFDSARDGAKVYNRFELLDDPSSSLRLERPMKLFGHAAVLTLTPLPGFFTYSDRFLPLAVAFGASFISILILLVLKASQSQLIFETQAKELSVQAMQKSRAHTELLKQLNESSRIISSELDLNMLIDRFYERVVALARSEASFFYFANSEAPDTQLLLRDQTGFGGSGLRSQALSLNEAMVLLPKSFATKKSDPDSADTFAKISPLPLSNDWLLLAIPSREIGRCGLIFLSRTEAFEETEIEIIESFVTRAATAIENAQLFRKVEGASRAKNAFLANMSHEIRTPLNAIIGFSEILIDDPVNREQRANLASNIRKGSHQLTRIIDDILDLSRIEAGRLHIEIRRIRLDTLLYEVKSVMDLRAKEKHIDFQIKSHGPLPSHIESDEVRLKQILMNVVGNAIKFTGQGLVHLTVSYRQDGPNAHAIIFQVRDTGSGIPADLQTRLFKPFSQGDDSKTRRHGGSGLGLALSNRLCQEMGGSLLLIESAPGRGSTFEASVEAGRLADVTWNERLTLLPPSDNRPSGEKSGKLSGLRVLLVEDSIDNQEIFRFFLETAGASVEIASDGLRGVSHGLAGGIDIILMDIQIPEIDGKEATRRLRTRGITIPIVALTAHALEEERLSCLAAGCDGQITKPVSGPELVSEVAQYARRSNGTYTQNFGRYETALSAAPQV